LDMGELVEQEPRQALWSLGVVGQKHYTTTSRVSPKSVVPWEGLSTHVSRPKATNQSTRNQLDTDMRMEIR
jgi:hypothetical protein